MADKLCAQAYQSDGNPAGIPQHEFAGFYFSHNGVIINDYSRCIGIKTWQHKIDAYYKERRKWGVLQYYRQFIGNHLDNG